MKRITLLLIAITACRAQDLAPVTTPAFTAADTILIGGTAPTGTTSNQVRIGGGSIWANGQGIFRGGVVGGVAQSDEVRISGGGVSTAQAMQIAIAGNSGTTQIYGAGTIVYGSAPAAVGANQVAMGGGALWAVARCGLTTSSAREACSNRLCQQAVYPVFVSTRRASQTGMS